jgi:recombination protein RecA
VEIYGPESAGKTTLVLHVLANAQRAGHRVAFVDAEHALDTAYAAALGVDLEAMLLTQPDSGEQALNVVVDMAASGLVQVIAVDSVAALTPQAEIDGVIGDSHVGLQARMMGQAMRKLAMAASRTGCLVLFINQLRTKVGVMFGSPETTPGGNALKFYASVRLDVRRIGKVKQGEAVTANQTRVKVAKSKVSPPHREVEFEIVYGRGIDRAAEVLDAALEAGLLTRTGAYIWLGERRVGASRHDALTTLNADAELLEGLASQLVGGAA